MGNANDRLNRIEKYLGIEDEEEYDEMLDWTEKERKAYYEDQKEQELERDIEMAQSCTCGAWHVINKEPFVIHVADCICGNGL